MATGRPGQRPNLPAEWAISSELAHTPLVSARDFAAAQVVRVRPDAVDHRGEYALVGLVQCGVCGRRMDSHWVHGRAGYRCRHGVTSASKRPADGPKWLYWREDRLVERVATTSEFADIRAFGSREMVADRMRATGKFDTKPPAGSPSMWAQPRPRCWSRRWGPGEVVHGVRHRHTGDGGRARSREEARPGRLITAGTAGQPCGDLCLTTVSDGKQAGPWRVYGPYGVAITGQTSSDGMPDSTGAPL